MKQSQVKPGVRALLSLGRRRGDVAVTVESLQRAGVRVGTSSSPDRWLVRQTGGVNVGAYHVVSARQLRPMPHVACQGELAAAYDAHLARSLRVVSSEPGQTIELADVAIETTLHRLG